MLRIRICLIFFESVTVVTDPVPDLRIPRIHSVCQEFKGMFEIDEVTYKENGRHSEIEMASVGIYA